MAERIGIGNVQGKGQYIGIGQHRRDHTRSEQPRRNAATIRGAPQRQRHSGMGDDRRHQSRTVVVPAELRLVGANLVGTEAPTKVGLYQSGR